MKGALGCNSPSILNLNFNESAASPISESTTSIKFVLSIGTSIMSVLTWTRSLSKTESPEDETFNEYVTALTGFSVNPSTIEMFIELSEFGLFS